MDPLNILIADDLPIFRAGMEQVLQRINRLFTIYHAGSGKSVFEILDDHAIDLIFMDIQMPGLDGIEITREIRKTNVEVKIVAVSMMAEKSIVIKMLNAGANGYLPKNMEKDQLKHIINVVMSGKLYLSAEISVNEKLPGIDHLSKNSEFKNDVLTLREIEILQLICNQYSTKTISEKLHLTEKTVETHRHHLFDKTNSTNLAGLIIYAIQKGHFNT